MRTWPVEIAVRQWLPADSWEVSLAPTVALGLCVCLCVWMSSASPHSTPKSKGTVWAETSANEDPKKQHLLGVLEEGDGRGGNKIRISWVHFGNSPERQLTSKHMFLRLVLVLVFFMKANEKSEKVKTKMCVVEGGKIWGLKPVQIGRKFVSVLAVVVFHT